jgi:hypothetical protein
VVSNTVSLVFTNTPAVPLSVRCSTGPLTGHLVPKFLQD